MDVIIAIGDPATFNAQPNLNKPEGHGSAKIIKYYPQLNKVDLIDGAQLTQNGDTIKGPTLSYNFVTEMLQGKSSKKERPTIIIQPKRVP